MREKLFIQLEALFDRLVCIRRDFHMYPELSFHEVETPKKIATFLRECGLEVEENVGGRGVIAEIKGKNPGKTIAFRADFDALPIQDEKELPYSSRVPGIMHACGHDIHTTSLLGVASVLSQKKEYISGNIRFIFQFAEEQPPGGAKFMIEDGCLKGVDMIYGAHVASILPTGMIGVASGPVNASADNFEIEIIGQGGHGAFPHSSIDPIVLGASLVMQLQQIVSRQIDPLQSAVLTIGTFHSGTTNNVIPEKAIITGTVRTLDENTRGFIEQRIEQITNSIVGGVGATAKIKYDKGYPVLNNTIEETTIVENTAKEVFGHSHVLNIPPLMGGEDFAQYLQHVPGCFFYVGGGFSESEKNYPHHHPKFDVDERSMIHIGKMFLSLVLNG